MKDISLFKCSALLRFWCNVTHHHHNQRFPMWLHDFIRTVLKSLASLENLKHAKNITAHLIKVMIQLGFSELPRFWLFWLYWAFCVNIWLRFMFNSQIWEIILFISLISVLHFFSFWIQSFHCWTFPFFHIWRLTNANANQAHSTNVCLNWRPPSVMKHVIFELETFQN